LPPHFPVQFSNDDHGITLHAASYYETFNRRNALKNQEIVRIIGFQNYLVLSPSRPGLVIIEGRTLNAENKEVRVDFAILGHAKHVRRTYE